MRLEELGGLKDLGSSGERRGKSRPWSPQGAAGSGRGRKGGAGPGSRPTKHVRRCGSRSPRSLVAATSLATTEPGHLLTCRGRGGGAGRSGVAAAGPTRESRRAGRLGGRGAGGGRECACARGRGNGRRRGSEKLEEAERLKGTTCGFCFLLDRIATNLSLHTGGVCSEGWAIMYLMHLTCYSRLLRQAFN